MARQVMDLQPLDIYSQYVYVCGRHGNPNPSNKHMVQSCFCLSFLLSCHEFLAETYKQTGRSRFLGNMRRNGEMCFELLCVF